MILKLDMKDQAMELYKVKLSHDPGMTLTFLWTGQLRLPTHLNEEIVTMSFEGQNLQ